MSDRRDIHEQVLQAKNPDELAAAYASWAAHYDNDLLGEMGYQAPTAAADLLHSHLHSVDIRILDAGCGTGLVGQALSAFGYTQLVGLDYSSDMLAQAQHKRVYTELLQGDLTQPLEMPDNSFGATICVGTFTLGHIGPDALSELIRVTQHNGLLCFTVREEAWIQDNYAATLQALEDRQSIVVVVNRLIPYIEEEHSFCHICLIRVKGSPG